MLQLAAVFRRQ